MAAIESVKIVVVGDGAVGKTSALIAYTRDSFPSSYVPTVFDNYSANVRVGERVICLSLWDTAGQEEYDRLRPLSYPQTDCFLVFFSVMSRTSFNNVKTKWFPEVMHHCPGAATLLVGAKADLRHDLERVKDLQERGLTPVTKAEGEGVSKDFPGCESYMECSALKREGLKDVFDAAIRAVVDTKKKKLLKTPHKKAKCSLL